MHLSAKALEQELSIVEAQTLLRGKFLRVSLQGNDYCFKIMTVKEIVSTVSVMQWQKEPGIIKDNICGSIGINNTRMPVFDLRAPAELLTHTRDETCFIIIIEAIANGLLLEFGILTNKLSAVVNHSMTEMSEDIVRSRLRGTMPFPAVKAQSCYK